MEKIKDLLINAYYDIMSNPLLSVIVRVIFICLILIIIAYFLFYAIISAVIIVPIYYIWKHLKSK
jgi:hypothetical protein